MNVRRMKEGEELTVVASEPTKKRGGEVRMRAGPLPKASRRESRDPAPRPHPAGAFPALPRPRGRKIKSSDRAAGTEGCGGVVARYSSPLGFQKEEGNESELDA